MIRVALRGLAGRKLRATLTAFAIILGVAMVSGTYVLTDTIDKAFDNIFSETYANTDAVVSGKTADISFEGDSADTPPVDQSVLPQIRALPDVESAAGAVIDDTNTKILKKDGDAVNTGGAPSFGFGLDPALPQFNPLKLLEGKWPTGPDQVVIDAATADEQGYKVGNSIKIATLKPVRSFDLVGLAQYGDVASIGSATFSVFSIPTAQVLLDRVGTYDTISVAGKEGVSQQALADAIKPILPPTAQVRTADAQAQEDAKDVSFTKYIRYFLLSFAGVALFVGAFVIFNILSITVAQRVREFATIRTIGGSRKQILWSVVLEAFVIGLVASLIGLFVGVGLAAGLNALFKALNADLPTQGLVFAPRTVIVSMLIGVGVTVIAGLIPAVRATRVPPIAAVREGSELPKSRISKYVPYIAIVVIGLSVTLLSYSLFKDKLDTATRLISMAVGVLLLFVGVAMVSSRTVRPLAVGTDPIAKWAVVLFSILVYPFTLSFWLIRQAAFGSGAKTRLSALAEAVAIEVALIVLASLLISQVLGIVVAIILAVIDISVLIMWLLTLARGLSLSRGRRLVSVAAGVLIEVAIVVLALLISTALGFVLAAILVLIDFVVLVMWLVKAPARFEPEWPVEFPNVRPEGMVNDVAKENSRRNPARTASTAAALMIGIALVTFVAVLASGMKKSNRGAIEDQVKAEYVVTAQDGFSPFVAEAGEAVQQSPDAQFVTSVRSDLSEADGESGYVTGIQPGAIAQAYQFDWKEGSDAVLAQLGRNGAIISDDLADKKDLAVGDAFVLLTPNGARTELVVKGIYSPPPFFPMLGNVSIPQTLFDSIIDRPRNSFVFVNVPGEPTAATTASLKAAVKDFPDSKVQTRVAWIDQQDQDFNSFLNMLYVLLALSVIISLVGMVITLLLSVHERTRELGMLRAVGMTRRQVRRMIRQESVITSLIGAALGLPLGIFLAILMTKALSQFEVRIAIPYVQLIVFAIVAILVGILAAILPARRAARLNVLNALQYE
jgi:ABC-type antimicrobial peptide transport system permease subunit